MLSELAAHNIERQGIRLSQRTEVSSMHIPARIASDELAFTALPSRLSHALQRRENKCEPLPIRKNELKTHCSILLQKNRRHNNFLQKDVTQP